MEKKIIYNPWETTIWYLERTEYAKLKMLTGQHVISLTCPKCKRMKEYPKLKVDPYGKVIPEFRCEVTKGCRFYGELRLKDWYA